MNKTNEQNRTRGMEIKNKLTVTREGGGKGITEKEAEEASQGT